MERTVTEKLKIIIISDGTGETATGVCRAVMTQFKDREVYFTRYKNVRTKDQIDAIFEEAAIHHDLIVYTIVSVELRQYIQDLTRTKHVRTLDVLGPALTSFSNYFEQEPSAEPGLLHAVNDDYFKRVEAMEFTLNHDDGRNTESLYLADIVLVGISRTSKTPLSVFLSLHGYKVVNIPLIPDTPLPPDLFKIDQRKIFALTIDPMALQHIRKNRLTRLGAKEITGDYANINQVTNEVEWANQLFKENKRWPVFNVTEKALEETAAEIIKLLSMRKNNRFKQEKSDEET
ncbi:MAG: bifunctional ([pyruvate, phosphate dikinase] phosphate) phosphotransferase/[pyruvate, phosphate dikinase] kinase [Bdellovibrio sp. CG12_big_fil_rev_8_21_14_0_65_39_13]|nr:MAG: bifunctional ([pyruvate, phosphate dikinase] phosphate) phosphotransferase/[pyruvate, phosphate dikinase] kinase [Bdellovibrio sp. CG22_combo_CG10-13_8_21_14_all_39_27]PIQ59755.1 MAG: bifunctional ([pyruvate, phosphate dikinase] phosphate) phosphotransferase/[pyruvate, phosphate dikinase] kinase [Bdellovibrio sp. CG12_big_fil_rev_8_21_14_0_65_39_13]PIR36215.1 MAG: bifunctional ([pyruvate, phosphate dikinase] phosphate) phosphotransferase/[pyruvate, phosphate dikinase] kinase [Bdellovibrio